MDDLELIERFLHGRLDQHEAAQFLSRLHTDQKLKSLFDQEADFESQLYDLALAHTSLPGLASETAWNELAVPEHERNAGSIPDEELRRMITEAVATRNQHTAVPSLFRTSAARYLLAASLLLAAGIAAALFLLPMHHGTPPVATAPPTRYEFESVPVYSLDHTKGDTIAVGHRESIIAIDTQTAAIAGQQTAIVCNEFRDTAITLDMSSGTALFSVEKGKYRYFTVITPFATVKVTGTVFRVNIEARCCFVSVENGAVDVSHTSKSLSIPVHPGETVRADADTLMQVWVDRSIDEMTASRTLLADFLERNATTSRERYGLSGNGGDSLVRSLRRDILMGTPGIDSMVRSLSRERKGNPDVCRLLLDLGRSYEGRRMWKKAAEILEEVNRCDTSAFSPLRETALYRQGRLLLQCGDTAAAMPLFRQFMADFPGSVWYSDIAALRLSLLRNRGDFGPADTLLQELFGTPGRPLPAADRLLKEHADALRENGLFRQALYWYEYIVTEYPYGKFHEDARYWAGWCVVQQSIEKREKRAFNHN